jgi:hypothetical protein
MTRTGQKRVQKALDTNASALSVFKYYIHDTAFGYAFEMHGPFLESSVSELSCCWETARTTLRDRTLTLDLHGITSLDEAAKQWLASMNQEGARCLPERFLRESLAGQPGREIVELPRRSIFGRLSNALRGCA